MKTHSTRYTIGDTVLAIDFDPKCKLTVHQVCIGSNGTTYEVAYWHNGKYRKVWLYEVELTEAPR